MLDMYTGRLSWNCPIAKLNKLLKWIFCHIIGWERNLYFLSFLQKLSYYFRFLYFISIILQITKSFLKDMIKNNHGHIVTIASVAGLLGIYKCTDYSATKFAAIGCHESLFTELKVCKTIIE